MTTYNIAQLAGAIEYTDWIKTPPNECPGMTLNSLMVRALSMS